MGRPLRLRPIELEGGKSAFVRVLKWHSNALEDPLEAWKFARLFNKYSVLRWIEGNASNLPAPRILAFDEVNSLLVTTVIPGLDVFYSYPRLSTAAKEHSVVTWARVSVLTFRLLIPQHFGSIMASPHVQGHPHIYTSAEHTFDTDSTTDLLSFFKSAIAARHARSLAMNTREAQEMLCRRLDRLLDGLKPLIARAQATASMMRFVLTHRDLRPDNMMLDETSGEVTGIVDWEFNECMPACMSVGYPSWIHSSSCGSPLYRDPANKLETFYFEPQEERNRLCDLYEKHCWN
ncbi:hypothetical protein B0H19DRAFT_1380736 [Mycena capillaripes]|nr:hypothetical protein B0H19DRAFT_1380736 [Mycena capillaripes]